MGCGGTNIQSWRYCRKSKKERTERCDFGYEVFPNDVFSIDCFFLNDVFSKIAKLYQRPACAMEDRVQMQMDERADRLRPVTPRAVTRMGEVDSTRFLLDQTMDAESAAKRALARALSPRPARDQRGGEELLRLMTASDACLTHAVAKKSTSDELPSHAGADDMDEMTYGPRDSNSGKGLLNVNLRRARSYKAPPKESEGELSKTAAANSQTLDSQVEQALCLANTRALGTHAPQSSTR